MINVVSKTCTIDTCTKTPRYNLPSLRSGLYCKQHHLEDMIDVISKKCYYDKCTELSIFGFKDKRPYACNDHKLDDMINLVLVNKCSSIECENEHDQVIDDIKYCNLHLPNIKHLSHIKKLCKYCDIREESSFVCKECKKVKNKKEWGIVRYLRSKIKTSFEYNSSEMLQGCSRRRPDIFFDLDFHCVIVEIDENQHKRYEESCECVRINEIVNGIGGKSLIIIRYNPDSVKHKKKILKFSAADKVDLLVKIIQDELKKDYDSFIVKIIQLFYDDNYETYSLVKEENITDKVSV
jgi:hypothetical protein